MSLAKEPTKISLNLLNPLAVIVMLVVGEVVLVDDIELLEDGQVIAEGVGSLIKNSYNQNFAAIELNYPINLPKVAHIVDTFAAGTHLHAKIENFIDTIASL